ncbi:MULTISPECIES: hemerythrin domain-containing protein [unclassified Chelatococcus]|uniref:hemerythrin domain-containing protein n=1 Tax=unclassified Chelatococcus TaxID=2638111 RepID=UPI001BCE2E70|nr:MULTISPECIES: hemerythrin domain-containing protein [unclassified Chelatococcus]MBS7698820.1 hemerythrin domain-containing protein [Chelatococcus sp. YT9]MBX3560091.1 hemerythrin domain-containing protein [Chelatococcus sp.]
MISESLSCALMSRADLDLCTDPVDILFVEHARQRANLDRIIRAIEDQNIDVATVAGVVRPLTVDAPLHRADEEESLFPLLFQRKRREDNMEPLIRQLLGEHSVLEDAAAVVMVQLANCRQNGCVQLPVALRADLLKLIFLAEAHLALENGIILPIAHQRLTLCDRLWIGRDFRSRRTRSRAFAGSHLVHSAPSYFPH